jgi:hypothetical protein
MAVYKSLTIDVLNEAADICILNRSGRQYYKVSLVNSVCNDKGCKVSYIDKLYEYNSDNTKRVNKQLGSRPVACNYQKTLNTYYDKKST